jgi:glycosyltransferase involved in cell wall biosynthesis
LASSKQHNLILITNHFPFGGAEAFLENEIGFLTNRFDKVIIAARDVTSPASRKGNFIAHRIDPKSNWKESLLAVGLCIRHFRRIAKYMAAEINAIRAVGKSLSLPVASVMVHDLVKAVITAHHLKRLIAKHELKDTVILYSYWLTSSALATTFVHKPGLTIKRISRAHGGDVYENRNKLHYLSFRTVLAMELDKIFTISENASAHLKKSSWPTHQNKIVVSRLGIRRPPMLPEKSRDTGFALVSCSYLVPVKRIHLLIDSLALVEGFPLTWIHIGDGPLQRETEEYASLKLSGNRNIQYRFEGAMTNENLIRFYTEKYVHLFLNTSESEGVPVTMMEAQSFGIPVVAPETGGIPEIISMDNGRLFPVNSTPQQISDCIKEVLSLPPAAYIELRSNARRNWETRYNAEQNFPTFVTEIFTLTA